MRVMSTWEDLLVRSRFSGKGERAARRFCFCSIFRTRSASKSFNYKGRRGPLAEGQKLHHEGHEGTTTKGTKEICIRFRLRTLHELALPTAKITCEAGRPRAASALHWRRACVRSCQTCRRSRTPASAPAGPIPAGRSSACADLRHESLAPVRSVRAG